MQALMRFFFYLLYHPLAFTYDLVAATVSVGRWKDWVMSVVPFLTGTRILEIGHGPGHLQQLLLSRGLFVTGIDESASMGRLAKRNLTRFFASNARHAPNSQIRAYAQIRLARGLAQQLPFQSKSFDSVVATFPTKYVFAPETLREAQRVLVSGGRFVILPSATILGRGLLDRMMASIFHITGQTAPNISDILEERTRGPFSEAGFDVQIHQLDIKSSTVFIIVARKSSL